MIYIDDRPDQLDLHAALLSVSPQRRDHALRYVHEHDRGLSLAAYMLLQRGLSEEYGINEPPVFSFDVNGKPVLADYPDIHFSLSHCRGAAACVIANTPVGIDIEHIDCYDKELMRHVMNDKEQQQIISSSSPQTAFTRLWTMKESFLKMTGEGIRNDMCHVLTNVKPQFTILNCQNAYVCTVCGKFC